MARYSVELSGHARRQIRALEPLWRIRIGDYRAVYKIEDDRLFLLVVNIGHRREVYR